MASKSLGTLTLDVVAKIGGFVDGLSKAERETKRKMDGISKSVTVAAGSLGALTVAAAASAAAIVTKTAASAKEIQNLSRAANTSAEDFQRITYASKQFGVEQDKVADIIKDVNDKIGDYLTTGAGPMADFFEVIAPLVGVTADNFRELSGPDALQLYVSSLEKANLSQAEMTFFMEAIASDATQLLPLLKNNGKELQNLGKQADQLGAVLSDLEIKQLGEVARSTKVLEAALDGAANQMTIALLPAMKDLSELLQDQRTIDSLAAIANGFGDVATFVADAAAGLTDFARWTGEELAVRINGVDPADTVRVQQNIDDLETKLENLRDWLKSSRDEDFDFVESLLGAPERIRTDLREQISETEKELEKLYKSRDAFASLVNDIAAPPASTPASADTGSSSKPSIIPSIKVLDAQKALNEEFQKTLESYQQQIALTGEVTELEKLRYEVTSGSLNGITAAQQRELEANAAMIDGYRELIEAANDAAEAEQNRINLKVQLDELQKSLLSEAELEQTRYGQQLELLKQAEANKIESIKPYQELREQLEQEHQDRLTKIANGGAMSRRDFEVLSFKDKAKTMAGLVQQFTQATAAEDRKMFELNKVAATANAVISTYEGIAKAWSFGPILGPIFAAIVAAGGFAQVRGIQSQSFGGGSIAPSVAATGATSLVATTQTAQQITPQSSGPSVIVNISGPVTGLNDDILAEKIVELIDRDYINLRSA